MRGSALRQALEGATGPLPAREAAHVGLGVRREVEQVMRLYGKTPTQHLHDLGILNLLHVVVVNARMVPIRDGQTPDHRHAIAVGHGKHAARHIDAYLKATDEIYVTDAYHSLSIEGYRVSSKLIERVRSGNWNPDGDEADRQQRDAMAARGYWQAYQAVRNSLERALGGENAGTIAEQGHGAWYREMFAPSVAAGILRPADLAGYRNDQVYIRGSKHVPPSREAVRDMLPALFDLLKEEAEASVRVVLGHFVFVYIHPYMDGNGRMGRFLMNLMLASGGYPWTVVPVEQRDDYMAALEEASVQQSIVPLTDFIASLVEAGLKGQMTAQPPSP